MYRIEAKDSDNKTSNLEYTPPERWKNIEGYDGEYQVSNKGRIRSWKRGGSGNALRDNPKIKRQRYFRGYKKADLSKNGNTKTIRVHRTVAKAFVDNPEDKEYINHKNCIKDDNRAINLEWVTAYENNHHAIDNGLTIEGEDSPHSKLTKKDILDIRNAYKLGCFTHKELGNAYGVSTPHIGKIVRREKWKHI